MICLNDEQMIRELTLDELDGVSGGKDSVVGKVTAAAGRVLDDAALFTRAILTVVTDRPF